MKEFVVTLFKLAMALIIAGLAQLFTGWVIYEVYQLVAMPIGLQLGLCMPHIPCIWFALMMLGITTIRYKKPEKSYRLEDSEFWSLLITKMACQSLSLLLVYILHSICF